MSPESILRCAVLACFVSAVYGGTAERLAEARLVYGDLLVGALQILPPLFAQFVMFAPFTTMQEVKAAGTTGDLPLLPYSMMMCNGFLWMCYGWLAGDKYAHFIDTPLHTTTTARLWVRTSVPCFLGCTTVMCSWRTRRRTLM